jgi:hypothetical protein
VKRESKAGDDTIGVHVIARSAATVRCAGVARVRRGVSTVKFAVALPSIIMMTWFGAEAGLLLRAHTNAKSAAEAIALAAAARHRDGHEAAGADALAAAGEWRGPSGPLALTIDPGAAGGGDVEFGHWDADARSFAQHQDGGPAVRARVRFASDHANGAPGFVLAGLFGTSPIAIEASAVAVHVPPQHITSLVLLSPGEGALEVAGSSAVRADGGISVASADALAVEVLDDAEIQAAILRVAGDVGVAAEDQVEGRVSTGETPVEDPFAQDALPAVAAGAEPAIDHDDGSTTLVQPGIHAGLTASGGRVVLQAGLHQFTQPIALSGTAILELDGATVQLDTGASLMLADSAAIVGEASMAAGDWSGFWMVSRGGAQSWSIAGTSAVDVRGICYAPDVSVVVAGGAVVALDAAVLGALRVSGDATASFANEIDELAGPVIRGRARLVR